MTIPPIVARTRLWAEAFPAKEDDADFAMRQRLRQGWVDFRSNAALLAAEIHRELPEFTVHDVSHLDALWEMADLIAGATVTFNPAEAFVFGGAVLLHDLGMALAAYPDRLESLKRTPEWKDEVTQQYLSRYGRWPTEPELYNPADQVKRSVVAGILRLFHARKAQELPMQAWRSPDNVGDTYMIPDPDLRAYFGEIIGKIAHSHWWGTDGLESEFADTIGAPPWCSPDWTVAPLRLACLLRLADASHIDGRRAPRFLWALRQTSDLADQHWSFQSRLNKPHVHEGGLVYTSGRRFEIQDTEAWWLCFDTIRMIDSELKAVDILLAERSLARFEARRVAGANSPAKLSRHVRTHGWMPADTSLHVGDVAGLVQKLGGRALYGNYPVVPLRELIQNAADAIRARRFDDGLLDPDWGTIIVRTGRDGDHLWLEVEDNGLGMSPDVVTNYLLDFGATYWGSQLMREQHPGLLSKGFKSTGQYGIGFFSIFMIGKRVRTITRPYKSGRDATIVLEFGEGLASRPILRPADAHERLRDGGTVVRVWLDESRGSLLPYGKGKPRALTELLTALAPALDVSVFIEQGKKKTRIVAANDWLTIPADKLVSRLRLHDRTDLKKTEESWSCEREILNEHSEVITDPDGTVLGRACIYAHGRWSSSRSGILVVGDLTSMSLSGIVGVLVGVPTRASRDEAIPLLAGEILLEWASRQAKLLAASQDHEKQLSCAPVLCALGASTEGLKVATSRGGSLSVDEIAVWCKDMSTVLVLQDAALHGIQREHTNIELAENVLIADVGRRVLLSSRDRYGSHWSPRWPEEDAPRTREQFHARTPVGAIVRGLGRGWQCDEASIWAIAEMPDGTKKVRREIGRTRNRKITHSVDVFKRPEVRVLSP